ncbi:MAG: DUF72 domain-containing protein [Bacteroidales bacterium]|nr:DUF72 domain-containing protein [Bacteroidales bacterium]
MKSDDIFIGTSGWSYRHWSGIFYPSDLDTKHFLEYYVKQFDCVELNSSFYHLPLKSTVEGWIRRTPDNFKFCLKLSRFITHQLQLVNVREPLLKFISVFERMKNKLGPVLVQLPPQMNYDKSVINDFLDLLREECPDYQFAFEVRNNTWINDEFLELLSRYKAAFVIADSGKRYPFFEAVTSDLVYIRFHGREQLYATDYSIETLTEFGHKIKYWADNGKKVWVFFNNDYHGYAVKNAEELISIINNL